MSEESERYLIVSEDEVTFLADGRARVSGQFNSHGFSLEEAREIIAEVKGVDQDSVNLRLAEDGHNRRRRSIGALGLGWNSPWEPSGGNPNLN